MMNTENQTPGSDPMRELEDDLAELGRLTTADLEAIASADPTELEDELLVNFRRHAESNSRERGWLTLWPWGLLAAAGLVVWIMLPEAPSSSEHNRLLGPILGETSSAAIHLERDDSGELWFDLGSLPPLDGNYELRLLDLDGNAISESFSVFDQHWHYDVQRFGPLPEQFQVEISTWLDSITGPEQQGESLRQPLSLPPSP